MKKAFAVIVLTTLTLIPAYAARASVMDRFEFIFRAFQPVPTPVPTPVPSPAPTPVPSPAPPVIPGQVVPFDANCTLKPFVNLRTAPSVSANVIVTSPAYPSQARAYSTQVHNGERWAWVTAGGREAWVRFDMLQDCKPTAQ